MTRYLLLLMPSIILPVVCFISSPFDRLLTCTSYGRQVAVGVSTFMEPADLTPAVDKFVRFPSSTYELNDKAIPSITARGPAPNNLDPFGMVGSELQPLSDYVKELVVSENPVLTMAASHFFEKVRQSSKKCLQHVIVFVSLLQHTACPFNFLSLFLSVHHLFLNPKRQGKRFRPTIVALMAKALLPTQAKYEGSSIHKKVLQLGQITEMIHVASLIHDDVLDEADTRRGGSAVHTMYTNKVAVLAGDYLLARASVLLARLQHFQVVEVMASALDALVQGEIMQARPQKEDLLDMNYYLRKSYFKTASLICSSCKSTALLAGYVESDDVTGAAEEFGYHLGMAYQIVDDILDFTGASASLGKPAQADMELGLATAPILFASETIAEVRPLIQRRFKQRGDVQRAVQLAAGTNCIERSYELADFHAGRAAEALERLPHSSQARDALLKVLHIAISRSK